MLINGLEMEGLHSEPHQTTLIKSKGTATIIARLAKCFQRPRSIRNKWKTIYCEVLRKTLRADPVRSNGCILIKTREIIKMPCVLVTVMRDSQDD